MPQISVSLLSVPQSDAVSIFYNLETAKIDYFHIDVMDGEFVKNNNLELMKQYSITLSHISNTGLDIHLMVKNVEEIMDEYIDLEPETITFHYEAIKNKERLMNIINDIKNNGIKVGIAINPETSINEIKEILPYIHQVTIMTVVPGKGGQKLIPETLTKIKDLKQYITENNIENINIEADGGINDKNSKQISELGCDILVAGSYVINSDNFANSIKKLKGEL